MSTGFIIYIICQFIVSIAIIYGYAHEEKVIDFENKLFRKIKRSVFGSKSKKSKAQRRSQRTENRYERSQLTPPAEHIDFYYFNAA